MWLSRVGLDSLTFSQELELHWNLVGVMKTRVPGVNSHHIRQNSGEPHAIGFERYLGDNSENGGGVYQL